jgi:KH domain
MDYYPADYLYNAAHEAFEILGGVSERGLRDLTNMPEPIDNVTKPSMHVPKTTDSRDCFCKLLLTKEEVAEVFTVTLVDDKSDLEAVTGVCVNSNINDHSARDHVLVMTGTMSTIHAGITFVADRLGSIRDAEFISVLRRKIVTMRVVVPNSVVGVLMGRGGKDIRNLAVSSGVRIQISQRVPGCLERVVHVTGTFQQAVLAATTIVETIQTDPHTEEHAKNAYFNGPIGAEEKQTTPLVRKSLTSTPETKQSNVATTEGSPLSAYDEAILTKCLQDLIMQLEEHPGLLSSSN